MIIYKCNQILSLPVVHLVLISVYVAYLVASYAYNFVFTIDNLPPQDPQPYPTQQYQPPPSYGGQQYPVADPQLTQVN